MVSEKRVQEILSTLTEDEKDAVYRSIWFDYVVKDIKCYLNYNDETLTNDEIEYAASRYVYDGKYDCTLSYWDNISSVIQMAKG